MNSQKPDGSSVNNNVLASSIDIECRYDRFWRILLGDIECVEYPQTVVISQAHMGGFQKLVKKIG